MTLDIPPMHRTRALSALVMMAIGLAALPAGAVHPEATIPLELRANERVTALAVEDDSSGWVAEADMEGRTSRLLHVRGGLPPQFFELPDLAVNRLTVIAESSHEEQEHDAGTMLFVGGAEQHGEEGHYIYRLLRTEGATLETAWDSALLPDGADAILRTDPSGELWGALHQRGDERLDLAVGPLPGYRPTMTVRLHSSWATGDVPPGVSSDWPSFLFLGSSSESPVLAILWQNLVYVVAAGDDPVRAVIGIESPGAANLHWQPSRRTLWVETSEGFFGYRIPPDITSRRPGGPIPVSDRLTGLDGGSPPTQIFPLQGGGVAVLVQTATGTRELRLPALESASPSVGPEMLAMPRGAWVDLSPSGTVALLLSDGPHSPDAYLFRLPPPSGH